MKSRKAKSAVSRRRPIGRKLLQEVLTDLEKRMKRQVLVAESIEALVAPNGQTVHGEYLVRTAIGQALEAHSRGMRDVLGLLEIIAEDRTVQS
jgi:hypothetical protein